MGRVFDVAFNDGQDEGVDKIALPDGRFRSLLNCRLQRDGRIEPRKNYVSLTNATSGGFTYTAYDLATFRDRLIALGSSDAAATYGRVVFNYVNNANTVWQSHFGAAVPPITELEKVYQSPAGFTADSADIAYANGQLCLVQADATNTSILVTRIDEGTGTILETLKLTAAFVSTVPSARVVACGNVFVVVMRRTNGTLDAYTYDTASGAAGGFAGPTTIEATAATGSLQWDLSPLGGTTDFLISYPRPAAGNTRLRRYTSAVVLVNTLDIAATLADSAVIGDTTHGVLYALRIGNDIVLRTCSTALVVTVGPTSVLGAAVGLSNAVCQPALAFHGTANVSVVGANAGTLGDQDTQFSIRSIAAHALVTSGQTTNMRTSTKLFTAAQTSTTIESYGIGSLPAGGNESSTRRFFSTAIHGVDRTRGVCAAAWNYGFADPLQLELTTNTGGRSSLVTDGSGNYWGVCGALTDSNIGSQVAGLAQIVKFRAATTDRRQAVEMQGALYLSGGINYLFDGGFSSAEAGFLDVPVIDSTVVASAAGALTLLAAYKHIALYEYTDGNGNKHRSAPSDFIETTLTGANNALTFTVSAPHTLRRQGSAINGVKVVLYRNTPNDSVFYRVAETTVLNSVAQVGTVTIVDTRSDVSAQEQEVLYNFSQKPIINVSPQPCRFQAVGKDRIIYGGLPDAYQVAFSQLTFPAEPVESASPNNFAFVARLPEPVTGVAAFGDAYIAFTADAIYQIPGAGPQRNGTGEFFYPQALYSDGGCIDWRSIVACGEGIFFQLDTDKIFLLSPQGGATWVGQPIRDTLADFPVIVGSCLCSSTQRVVFACTNVAGSDGALLVYDLRRKVWSVDPVGATSAVVEYLGRLAYIQGGVVFLENAAVSAGSGALPSVSVRTGSFKLFPANGQGTLCKVVLSGTYQGDSTIEGFISYDDGKTWTSMGPFAATAAQLFNPVTGAAISAGDPVCAVFTPNRREVDRFALRFDMTHGTDTGGTWLHMVSLDVEAAEFITRQPARNQR